MSINIPRFYSPDPQMFFVNVESQFALANITEEKDKYVQLTAKLEPEVLAEVSEVLKNEETRTYTHVKNAILKRFCQSDEDRLNKLLGSMELGDKPPSQILREIQKLGPEVPESIIRGLWLKKLPSFTQQILQAVSVSTTLSQQAEVADKVMSVPGSSSSHSSTVSPFICATSTAPKAHDHDTLSDQISQLSRQVSDLTDQIKTLVESNMKLNTSPADLKNEQSLMLFAANDTQIKTFGQRLLSLDFDLRREFAFVFTIAEVCTPILGADFIKEFGLLVDLKNSCLIDPLTTRKAAGHTISSVDLHISPIKPNLPLARFLHSITEDLPFVFVYIDDFLVSSSSMSEHLLHLEQLFKRFSEYGLSINVSKSKFAQEEVIFLGYSISAKGIAPSADKIADIAKYPKPTTVGALKRFLGMINFYHRFYPKMAEIQSPLHLKGQFTPDTPLIWTDQMDKAFSTCKQTLIQDTVLAFPDPDMQLSIMTDASATAVGGAVNQIQNGIVRPLAFFSRRLSPAEEKYSTYDRELLAIYATIHRFSFLLEGRPFTIFTDHRPLTYAFTKAKDTASPRQIRHLSYVSQFSTDIQFVKGQDNAPADFLSRIETIVKKTISATNLSKAQDSDPELKDYLENKISHNLYLCRMLVDEVQMYCDLQLVLFAHLFPKTSVFKFSASSTTCLTWWSCHF
ncbi:hypothetical protein WDU94_015626 [Cyamophila willieti]